MPKELGTHVDHLVAQADAYAAKDYAGANTALPRGVPARASGSAARWPPASCPPDQAARARRAGLAAPLGDDAAARRARGAGAGHAAGRRDQRPRLPGDGGLASTATRPTSPPPSAASSASRPRRSSCRCGPTTSTCSAPTPRTSGRTSRTAARRVQDDLHNWQQRFAAFIDTATQSRVPAPDLAAALLGLDDLLLQQVDAFAARDFPRAQQLANQTYPQVFGLARNLADAFGATLAARMPQGGAKTGAGGMAADLVPPAGRPPAAPPAGRRTRALPFGADLPGGRAAGPAADPGGADRHAAAAARPGRRPTVEVPRDFGVAGWFADGPRPGQNGPAVILGHVDSRTGPGVFYPLAGLAAGTEVLVDRADGSTVAFRVSGVVTSRRPGSPPTRCTGPPCSRRCGS